jgi:hypothetical protein
MSEYSKAMSRGRSQCWQCKNCIDDRPLMENFERTLVPMCKEMDMYMTWVSEPCAKFISREADK